MVKINRQLIYLHNFFNLKLHINKSNENRNIISELVSVNELGSITLH